MSDQDIAAAVENLLRESNPSSPPLNSLNDVVQQLESKLGFPLNHKIDFIRNQIHLLLRPIPPPQPPPSQFFRRGPPTDQFSIPPHQNPSFRPPQFAPGFGGVRSEEEEAAFRQPCFGAVNVDKGGGFVGDRSGSGAAVASAAAPEPVPKESVQSGKKRRGGPGGLNKLCGVTPELQVIVGQPALPRTEIVKQLWAYIRKNNLQDPSNKRKIICNDELRLVFETDCTDMFKMNKLLAKHIIALEPTKQTTQNSKKQKIESESASRSTETVPVVMLSDALANFFATGEKEMSQAEVLRRVWEYIKVNQLVDPLNAMVILCDTKLQELLGCESISALGVPEMLARHHLFKR